ncbi:MAG: hypothetical protein ACREIT_09720 [Tepidisphaeraceae bacterium]
MRSKYAVLVLGCLLSVTTMACRSSRPAPAAPVADDAFAQRRVFARVDGAGTVTDLALQGDGPGALVVAAAEREAAFIRPDGSIERTLKMPRPAPVYRLVRTGNQFQFLAEGDDNPLPAVVDAEGGTVWSLKLKEVSGPFLRDADVVDTGGSMARAYVLGLDNNVRLLNHEGRELWRRLSAIGTVKGIEVAGNGTKDAAIVTLMLRGEVVHLSPAEGAVTKRFNLLTDAEPRDLRLVRYPADGPEAILCAAEEKAYIFSLDGKTKHAVLPAPKDSSVRAAWVKLKAGDDARPMLALLTTPANVSGRGADRTRGSTLYLYDADLKPVYQGEFPDVCEAILAAPASEGGVERLLVGGRDRVWEIVPR